jgi:hypothetical protein
MTEIKLHVHLNVDINQWLLMVLNTIQIIISLDSENVDALTNKDVTLTALHNYYTAIKYCESPLAYK